MVFIEHSVAPLATKLELQVLGMNCMNGPRDTGAVFECMKDRQQWLETWDDCAKELEIFGPYDGVPEMIDDLKAKEMI